MLGSFKPWWACDLSPGSVLLARIWTIKVFYQLLCILVYKLCSVCTKSPTNSMAARFAICSWTRKSGGHPVLTSHCSAQAPGTDWIHAGGHRPVARQVQATELGEIVIRQCESRGGRTTNSRIIYQTRAPAALRFVSPSLWQTSTNNIHNLARRMPVLQCILK